MPTPLQLGSSASATATQSRLSTLSVSSTKSGSLESMRQRKRNHLARRQKKHLSDLVFNRDVILDCGKTDRYRRKICVVMIDGQDANLAQVKAGMAWWYRRYQREQKAQQRADYEAAEATAKAGKEGLWRDVGALPPWEWRHK